MSDQQSTPNPADKLARFNPEVREAYARFKTTGDIEAVQFVVMAMIRDHLPKPSDAPITDDKRLVEDLGYDSLAVAEVVFAIEDLFGLRIETSEIMQISTVGSLKNFIAQKIGHAKT